MDLGIVELLKRFHNVPEGSLDLLELGPFIICPEGLNYFVGVC